MVPEILNGLLWQSRLAIRTGGARAFAAHGYVDPSYRPPRLPFVSVVGPLSLHVEPERENGKAGQARIKIPGYVIGAVRPPAASVPAAGRLALRFDGRASVALVLAGLPGTTFADPATGPAIAQAINDAITAALAGGQFRDSDGSLLTDPTLLAALTSVAVRYSLQTQQFVITSTPGTASTGQRSLVEILPSAATDLAGPLGLVPPFKASEGRQRLHKLPAPRPMTVEVRLDLWAQSQLDMAIMFDALANAAPTRGRLVLRPSLLAADAADGDFQLRLLDRGEPTTPDSLVHLEGGDGLIDRARGVSFTASAGASRDAAASQLVITGGGQITGAVYASPLIPDPLFSATPAPIGAALALGIALDAAAADGDAYPLLSLTRGASSIASLGLTVISAAIPAGGTALFGELTAHATLTGAAGDAIATTIWRLPLAQLQAGGTLHTTINGDTGAIALAWDGEPQRLDDPTATPTPPSFAPGTPALGPDMTLVLGGGAGAPYPRALGISHLHLFSEPYGPLDPRLRSSLTGVTRLRPGDMIAVVASDDGWHVGDTKSLALVDSVVGGVVNLTRPIAGGFARGRAIVYQDECFYFQTAVKRRDDLMNRLYHCSVDYRVSALLEDPIARSSATLVLETQELVTARGVPRASAGHPGVVAVEAEPARGVN